MKKGNVKNHGQCKKYKTKSVISKEEIINSLIRFHFTELQFGTALQYSKACKILFYML